MLDVTARWYLMHRHTVLLGLILDLIKTAHTDAGDVANALVMVPWAHVRVRTDEGRWQDVLSDSTLAIGGVNILLVLIEADHLGEDLFRHGVNRCQLEGCDGHLHVAQPPDYGLNLRIVNAVKWFNHH